MGYVRDPKRLADPSKIHDDPPKIVQFELCMGGLLTITLTTE